MAGVSAKRVRDDLSRLADRGRGVRDFSLEAARIIRRAVPFDGVCVLTLDPVARVPTGEVVEGGLPDAARTRMADIEFAGIDLNTFAGLLQARCPAATLSAATGGELDRSLRQREVRAPSGFGDELRAVLVEGSTPRGALTLLRTSERPPFTADETALVASATKPLASGLRRALLGPARMAVGGDERPASGVAILAADGTCARADDVAERWLAELNVDRPGGGLPRVVTALARRARTGNPDAPAPTEARVRTASGTWLVVRASALGRDADAEVAVVLEPARSAQLAPLMADAYGLTERERMITEHVAHGLATEDIAARELISPFTVQDHLKSIFEKVGVRSRGELVARIFFDPEPPRLTP
jgi:DNA-binding CsgD family transcriptional regulator